jgi:hypothetical protein
MSVWPSRGRYLGIGIHSICPSFCTGADDYLLSSPDATDWIVVGQLPPAPAGIFGVYETDLGFFAVGQTDFWNNGKHAGMWHSSDGTEWTSLSDEPAFQPGGCGSEDVGSIDSVYQTALGLLAFGIGEWLSADGALWMCTDSRPVGGVQRVDDGFVGVRYENKEVGVWRSQDGIKWTRSGAIDGSFDIVPVESGFVAVEEGDPRLGRFQSVKTSADGESWEEDAHPFQPAYVYGLKSNGTTAVAVDQSDPAIWLSSPDGSDWTRYAVPTDSGGTGEYELEDVTLFGGTLIVTLGRAEGGAGPAFLMAQIP